MSKNLRTIVIGLSLDLMFVCLLLLTVAVVSGIEGLDVKSVEVLFWIAFTVFAISIIAVSIWVGKNIDDVESKEFNSDDILIMLDNITTTAADENDPVMQALSEISSTVEEVQDVSLHAINTALREKEIESNIIYIDCKEEYSDIPVFLRGIRQNAEDALVDSYDPDEDYVPNFLKSEREKRIIERAKKRKEEATKKGIEEARADLMAMMFEHFNNFATYEVEMISKRLSSGDIDEFVDSVYGVLFEKGLIDEKLQRKLDFLLYGKEVGTCIS